MDLTRFPIGRVHRVLAFVREGDPVPRADKLYVDALLDLYRVTVIGDDREGLALENVPQYALDDPHFKNFGHLVVVKDNNEDARERGGNVPEDLYAYDVPKREFEKLIYGTIWYHQKLIYVNMARKIWMRCYNGYNGAQPGSPV